MLDSLKKLWRDEDGQGMTEYILIVVLIAIAGIAAWRIFGKQIISMVERATGALRGAESN